MLAWRKRPFLATQKVAVLWMKEIRGKNVGDA